MNVPVISVLNGRLVKVLVHSEARKRIRRCCAIAPVRVCLLILGILPSALAQYHLDSWTTDNGLPHNAIRDILQTRDGYLWLATADGLVRFDGLRFTTFNRENSPGMSGNRITALVQDSQGDLWIGSESTVMRLHEGVIVSYGSESGVPGGMVDGVALDPSGYPLILSNEYVLRWHEGRFTSLNNGPLLTGPTGFPVTHFPEPAGFWSQSGEALEVYVHGRLSTSGILRASPAIRMHAVAEDEYGTIWAAATGKLFRFKPGQLAPEPLPSGCSPTAEIRFVAGAKLKLICYAPNSALVRGSPGDTQQEVITRAPPPSLELNNLC